MCQFLWGVSLRSRGVGLCPRGNLALRARGEFSMYQFVKFLPFSSEKNNTKINTQLYIFDFQRFKIFIYMNTEYEKRTTFAVYYFTNTVKQKKHN